MPKPKKTYRTKLLFRWWKPGAVSSLRKLCPLWMSWMSMNSIFQFQSTWMFLLLIWIWAFCVHDYHERKGCRFGVLATLQTRFFLEQVHEQVRREYHRLVLELSDPHSRSNATGGAFQQISRVEDATWYSQALWFRETEEEEKLHVLHVFFQMKKKVLTKKW